MSRIIKIITQSTGNGTGNVNAYTFSNEPTINDDLSSGYNNGDRWIDSTNGNEFTLIDNTNGSAIWKKTTELISGNGNNEIVFEQNVIFEGAIALSSSVTSNISGTVDDLEETGISNTNVLRLTGSGNISGIKAPIGGLNQVLYVLNVDGGNKTIQHNNNGSLSENRILCKNNRTLQLDEAMSLVYDDVSQRWRMTGLGI